MSALSLGATDSPRLPDGTAVHYERHRPEQTTLYRLVQEHAASFIAHTEASTGKGLPQYVKDEFEAYLKCGILAHGFLRLRCDDCGHDKLLAFSCKRRGFCPSCGARRMGQSAAYLVDHVIPAVPVRQWVLALPVGLRLLLAAQPQLLTPVLQVVHRVIGRYLRQQAGLRDGQGGAVTLIQRFGSAANLNIHLHCLVLDGVYRCDDDSEPQFVAAAPPTDEELARLLQTMISRMLRMLTRRGVLEQEAGQTWLADTDSDADQASALWPLQAAAVTYRIAFGPRAGHKVLTVRGAPPREYRSGKRLCADIDGFSLHAAVRVPAHERGRLERLCRYITRPALAEERIELDSNGQVRLRLKTPWRDGTTHLVLSPLQLMQRLAALVPRPRGHLIRFHGVLAPNARLRARVVPTGSAPGQGGQADEQKGSEPNRPGRIGWARLLKRLFDIDMSRCPNCGQGQLKRLAPILERAAIEKILTHLGIDPQPPPRGKARMPRADQAW